MGRGDHGYNYSGLTAFLSLPACCYELGFMLTNFIVYGTTGAAEKSACGSIPAYLLSVAVVLIVVALAHFCGIVADCKSENAYLDRVGFTCALLAIGVFFATIPGVSPHAPLTLARHHHSHRSHLRTGR
jgi:hypothetical protein